MSDFFDGTEDYVTSTLISDYLAYVEENPESVDSKTGLLLAEQLIGHNGDFLCSRYLPKDTLQKVFATVSKHAQELYLMKRASLDGYNDRNIIAALAKYADEDFVDNIFSPKLVADLEGSVNHVEEYLKENHSDVPNCEYQGEPISSTVSNIHSVIGLLANSISVRDAERSKLNQALEKLTELDKQEPVCKSKYVDNASELFSNRLQSVQEVYQLAQGKTKDKWLPKLYHKVENETRGWSDSCGSLKRDVSLKLADAVMAHYNGNLQMMDHYLENEQIVPENLRENDLYLRGVIHQLAECNIVDSMVYFETTGEPTPDKPTGLPTYERVESKNSKRVPVRVMKISEFVNMDNDGLKRITR